MYFCYIDESGTPQIPGNTSHYVLAGISMPVRYWKQCDGDINKIKTSYELQDAEIHTGWIARTYLEQSKIINFESLSYDQRRYEVDKIRKRELLRLQKIKNGSSAYKQVRKNYKQTEKYTHLTHAERLSFLNDIASYIGDQSYMRIFAECIDKIFFDPKKTNRDVDEQCLEQLVSRFERYMSNVSHARKQSMHGALIHDNNETVSKKHTQLMRKLHRRGTGFSRIDHIIETPLFVNSELTSMVQIADLCAYSLRRYFENSESQLLDLLSPRFDMHEGHIVGVRHFADKECSCMFCKNKNQSGTRIIPSE